MLVLGRKQHERINIGADIEVVVLTVQGNRVRLGLIAPAEVPILRGELQAHAEQTLPGKPLPVAARPPATAGGPR
jgi:carbon storage regulator CsrA